MRTRETLLITILCLLVILLVGCDRDTPEALLSPATSASETPIGTDDSDESHAADKSTWAQVAILTHPEIGEERFGDAVDLFDDRIMVGALADDPDGRCGFSFRYIGSGGVYLEAVFRLSAAGGEMGHSVALSEDHVAVGQCLNNYGHVKPYNLNYGMWDGRDVLWAESGSPNAGTAGFGHALAIKNDLMVVGAYQGIVTLYRYDNSDDQWNLAHEFVHPERWNRHEFGNAVAVSNCGGCIQVAIGSPMEGGSNRRGKVYVYTEDASNSSGWSLQTLTGGSNHWGFGTSVAFSRDYLVVGDPSTNEGANGRVYVYDRVGSTLSSRQAIRPRDDLVKYFGNDVDINGDRIIVSADYYPLNEAVFIFNHTTSGWQKEAKLVPSEASYGFGCSVAIHDDLAVVGSIGMSDGGKAFVYEKQ